jgi:hypothetical protein
MDKMIEYRMTSVTRPVTDKEALRTGGTQG